MSYVPPHLRNKQPTNDTQEQLTNTFKNERRPPRRVYDKPPVESVNTRIIEKTEENFPTLVSVNPTLRTQPGGRKFNELASDWKVEDDIRKEQEQLGKETNKNNVFILPKFRSVQRFSEPEDNYPDNEPEPVPQMQDEWTIVNTRKPRKPKSERTREEDNTDQPNEEDDTVWEAPEEESCWDQY